MVEYVSDEEEDSGLGMGGDHLTSEGFFEFDDFGEGVASSTEKYCFLREASGLMEFP